METFTFIFIKLPAMKNNLTLPFSYLSSLLE